MARPRREHPTPAELEVLHLLWRDGTASGRDVMEQLNRSQPRPRAYTTVMSLLNTMVDKGFLRRKAEGRAFIYSPRIKREPTLRRILADVVDRAFEGSARALVANLLDQARPDRDEIDAIHRAIAEYRQRRTKDKHKQSGTS